MKNMALVVGAILFSLFSAEILARLVDGRGLYGGPVYFGTPPDVPIESYMNKITLREADLANLWKRSPAPLKREFRMEDLERKNQFGENNIDTERSGQVTPAELFKVWNSRLVDDACSHDALKHLTRWPFYVFEPPDGEDRPRFRHRPQSTLPIGLGFVTNQIGWRGKPIAHRRAETVRIVFVGASAIAEGGSVPWSAPELIEEWLNDWARGRGLEIDFQVLNAGREGAHTEDVLAIVREEVVPLQPDLVIFYEGALDFDWSSTVEGATTLKALQRPEFSDSAGWIVGVAQRSSLVAHVLTALGNAGISVGRVGEAEKPGYRIVWPKGLDEQDPDLDRKDLPLNLGSILGDLDRMRQLLLKADAEFALSSFAWLAYDRMKLDPVKGRYIWETDNRVYWPWTYRDIRRGVDFENRTYRKFARTHGLSFLNVADLMPPEPLLFADGVHMTASGVRVKAWAFFLEMLPLVEQRLAQGHWPRHITNDTLPTFEVTQRFVHCN